MQGRYPDSPAPEVSEPDRRDVQRGLHRDWLPAAAAVMGQHDLARVEPL
jgi:hypothetical protein